MFNFCQLYHEKLLMLHVSNIYIYSYFRIGIKSLFQILVTKL